MVVSYGSMSVGIIFRGGIMTDERMSQGRHVSRPGSEIRINGVREASSKTQKNT